MSAGGLDDLARALASSMPRRRALRLAAGALVAVALPGGRATAASGATTKAWVTAGCGKGGGGLPCATQFGPQVSECCGPIDKSNPDSNYTCCPPGECWHHPGPPYPMTTCCPEAYRCRGGCCNDGEKCVEGKCTRCPSDKVCGKDCCEASQDCVNRKTSLCCMKTWKRCEAGLAGVVKCCPPRDTCCFNPTTKQATCCDAQHPCVNGRCKCKKDETPCGDKDCCKKGQICSNGKCCPKGKINCGDERCCDKGQCCGDTCCGGNEFCASSIAYSKPKVCCTSNRIIVSPSGKPVCCPKGTVPNDSDTGCCPSGNPNCCGDELGCLGNTMCVRGICQKVS